jgi:hypothetical protein
MKKFLPILLIFVLVSCSYSPPDTELARDALQEFFEDLSRGNYSNAVDLYGGNYDILLSFNPDIAADDRASLWENGCKINGLQCLRIRTINYSGRNESGAYIFELEFNAPEGDLFVVESCCDENQSTTFQSKFEYRVAVDKDGNFQVLDLPVYLP